MHNKFYVDIKPANYKKLWIAMTAHVLNVNGIKMRNVWVKCLLPVMKIKTTNGKEL